MSRLARLSLAVGVSALRTGVDSSLPHRWQVVSKPPLANLLAVCDNLCGCYSFTGVKRCSHGIVLLDLAEVKRSADNDQC